MNYIIIAIVLGVTFFEIIVDVLNYKNRNAPLPDNVKNIFDPKEYRKSLDYSMAKSKFGIVSKTVRTLLIVGLFLFGFFPWMESIAQVVSDLAVIQTLVLLFGYYLVNFVFMIPFSYYRDFVIEAQFGFNKKTKKIFILDLLKSIILSMIIGGAMMASLTSVYILFADTIALFIATVFILIAVFMFGAFIAQGWFVRKFNKLIPLQEGTLKARIDQLATGLGFKINRIFVMDGSKRSSHANAYFSGIGKTKEIVLFDTLIEQLTEDEVVAVMAHELGHAVNKDAPKLLIRNLVMVAIYAMTLGLILTNEVFFTDFGLDGIQFGFAVVLMLLVLGPIEIIFGLYANSYSRKFEYRADAFAAKHTSKEIFNSALRRMAKERFSNLTPHPLYVWVYYNHPTTSQRLKA
jgi:STE24 endopeptidase